MKAYSFLSIFLISAVLVISCKDEAEREPRQVTKSYTYSQNLRGSEGVRGELPLSDLNLSDILGADTVSNLTRAEIQLADTYLEISGLNQVDSPDTVAVVLEDFTIKIGNRQEINLGNFSTDPQGTNEFASDVQYSTNQVVNLIQGIFSEITSERKRTNINVSFTPNVDITSADNVQLIIHFGGIYHFVVD